MEKIMIQEDEAAQKIQRCDCGFVPAHEHCEKCGMTLLGDGTCPTEYIHALIDRDKPTGQPL